MTTTIGVAPQTAIAREVARHVERHRLVDAGQDDHVVRHHAEREAIGRRARQRLQADDAAGAGLVVDDHRVAQRLGQRRLRGARDRVDARAGGVGQDEAQRLVALGEGGRARARPRPRASRSRREGVFDRHVVSRFLEMHRCSGHRLGFDQRIDLALGDSRCRRAPRACVRRASVDSAARRGRWPSSVIGNSVVFTGCPARSPSVQPDIGQAAGGREMRVVEQLLGFRDRRERQARGLEAARQLGGAECASSRSPRSASSVRPRAHAVVVGLSAGSAFRSSKPSASQKVSHCASLTAARKICSPSLTVNTS